ncbi:hypothetical protein EDC04DRAFT_2894952 [Pisolithus marmoratus]|nr:hypothetical protein EDC04DRAFT_2894952 [Pisolithus marmoratus]
MTGSTTFISSNPGLERKTLVPTYYMDAEELEDQPVSHVRIVAHENFRVAMGMDYNAESDNEFDQPIYEEVQTGLKHKQSDCDDDGYVTSSEVEDFNDGYEDHELHFTNNEKKVKVKKDADQELGQASSMTTRGKASKHHCQKNLPSVLMEDRDLKRTGIKGVLALTCAVLHHTLTLYNEGMLDLDVRKGLFNLRRKILPPC